MSTNAHTGNQSVGTTETVEVPKDEYEELTQLAEIGKLVEVRTDRDTPALEDIWLAGQPVGKIIESNRKKADTATKQTRGAGSSDPEPEGKTDETTLERIADDEQENPAGVTVGPSIDRASAIMSHWKQWSDKAPKGRTIKDGLKTLIETVTEESLAWKQVYRACKKVEQLTKGKLVFMKHKKHGWMLLEPNKRASSVGTGG